MAIRGMEVLIRRVDIRAGRRVGRSISLFFLCFGLKELGLSGSIVVW